MKNLLLTSLLALSLTACAVTPSSPAQTVYLAKTQYSAALSVAVAYKNLPGCGGTEKLCAKPEVVAQLQKADQVAYPALDAAEDAVRTPGFGENIINSAVIAAKAAVEAFKSITNTLKVK